MEYKGKNNLIGQKFGKLLVLEYLGRSRWKCQCDCGNFTEVVTSSLTSGKTKSCGCLRGQNTVKNTRTYGPKIDLTNKRFGRLIAKKYIKGGFWRCLCDCGNEVIVDTRNLNSNHTRSCGCLLKDTNSKNNTYDMSEYETEYLKVLNRAGSDEQGIALWECQCKICKNIFITRGVSIRRGDTKSCGCIQSLNEIRISQILTDNNIEYCTQYTFPDLKSSKNGSLRFDFAIFKNHTLSHLIEFNGKQHYYKIPGKWGESFEEGQERDRLKQEYCKLHNIPLVIIRYDEEYDLNTLLNNL